MAISRKFGVSSRRTVRKRTAGLHLVSLMDVFTILVFFLLINSGEVELIENFHSVELPESVSETKAQESVQLTLTAEAVFLETEKIADITELETPEQQQAFKSVLQQEKLKIQEILKQENVQRVNPDGTPVDESEGPKVRLTLMADKQLAYAAIHGIMKLATESGFENIALAFSQAPSESDLL